jgi:hypothetical protein
MAHLANANLAPNFNAAQPVAHGQSVQNADGSSKKKKDNLPKGVCHSWINDKSCMKGTDCKWASSHIGAIAAPAPIAAPTAAPAPAPRPTGSATTITNSTPRPTGSATTITNSTPRPTGSVAPAAAAAGADIPQALLYALKAMQPGEQITIHRTADGRFEMVLVRTF